MITKNNLPNHELIGLEVEIIESKNKTLIGKKGKIVDETRNCFVIREINNKEDKESKVIKKDSTFSFKVGKQKIKMKGEIISKNPWERIKKRIKVKNRWQRLE